MCVCESHEEQALHCKALYCHLVKLREIQEMAKIVKMMDFRHFRMPDGKCPKNVKIMDFRIFRMSDLTCPKMVKIMDFRIFRISNFKCRNMVKMIEQASQSDPGDGFLTHFDSF